MSPDVLVAGGGLLGWSAAYRIVKSGQRVTVVDRADPGYATQAGAGIVAPGTSLAAAAAFYPLGKAGVDYYDRLIPELAGDGETGTGYEHTGMMFVARDELEWNRLPEALRRMTAQRDSGMGNLGALSVIDNDAAHELFPPLAEIAGALLIPGAARVNAGLLRDALRAGAVRHGAVAATGSAEVVVERGRVTRVTAGSERWTPGEVVIAGGAWSNRLGQELGVSLPVYPQRGQIIHLDLPGAETARWPIVGWFGSHYIVTFGGERVVVGATREHESGYDVRVTAAGMHEVLAVALQVAPGLAPATVAEVRVGLRPFSPDGLPILGRAPGVSNAWLCTGHGPSGIQLGPVSGALIARLIAGEEPGLDLSAFSPARYQ